MKTFWTNFLACLLAIVAGSILFLFLTFTISKPKLKMPWYTIFIIIQIVYYWQ